MLAPRTVTIAGYPHQPVVVSLSRATAGTLSASSLTLDNTGAGTVSFTPCAGVADTCLGAATIQLSIGNPKTVVASQAFNLVYPTTVGEVAPCQVDHNQMYLHGNDFIVDGVVQSGASTPWTAWPALDQIAFEVGDVASGDRFVGRFSLLQLPLGIAPGLFERALRYGSEVDQRPEAEVTGRSRGCNVIASRFRVHDWVADPVHGTVYSATISFEQACDPEPDFTGLPTTKLTVGCFHYQQTPPIPVVPPTPDPSKVSVRVYSSTFNGAPDPNARALFVDPNGTIVLDTQVNSFGQAEASMPLGGTVTTIQSASGGYAYLSSYRGVSNGNHLEVNATRGPTGAVDQMLVSYAPPPSVPDQYVGLVTACSNGQRFTAGRAAINFYDGCRTPTFSVLALATPPDGPAQYLWNTGLTHNANNNVALASTWSDMDTATVALTNVPAGLPPIYTQWVVMVDASPYVMGATTANGNQTLTVKHAPGAGNGTIVTASVSPNFLSSDQRTVADPGSPTAVAIDFAAQQVPAPSSVQQSSTGVTWTQTPGDADVRELTYRATTPTSHVVWHITEPNDGQASSTLPTLPPQYSAIDPAAHSNNVQLFGVQVSYTDYDVLSAFRLAPPSGPYRAHTVRGSTFDYQFPF